MSPAEIDRLAALIRATPVQAPPASPARERQLVGLRLASPKRAGPGRLAADQADAGHLPLFIAADEPRLI